MFQPGRDPPAEKPHPLTCRHSLRNHPVQEFLAKMHVSRITHVVHLNSTRLSSHFLVALGALSAFTEKWNGIMFYKKRSGKTRWLLSKTLHTGTNIYMRLPAWIRLLRPYGRTRSKPVH